MRGYSFFVLFAGFMGGIAFRSFFDLGHAFVLLLALLAGMCLFFISIGRTHWMQFEARARIATKLYVPIQRGSKRTKQRRNAPTRTSYSEEKQALFYIPLVLTAFFLGVLRFEVDDFIAQKNEGMLSGGNVKDKHALVVEEPRETEKSTRLIVRFRNDQGTLLETKVLISTDLFPRYAYGDEMVISGKLEIPENFTTVGGKEFNYRAYLAKDGIRYTMYFPKVKHISSGNGNVIKSALFSLKRHFLGNLSKLMPQPHAGFMGGLVLGAEDSLGKGLEEDFRRVGLIHIIVLSGYNIAVVAEAVLRLFSFAPRRVSFILSGVAITLFAIMTGGHAAVVRASIMALFVLLARATGRRYDIVRALLLAAAGMVALHPQILVFDISFQLSFLATLSLIMVAPIFEKYFQFVPNIFSLRENLIATVSTQLFVFPLLLYTMGQFSVISLVANLFVLPVIPFSMFVGFACAALAFISTVLATPFAMVGTFLLSYVLFIVRSLADVPFASFSVPPVPFWGIICVYLLYACGIFYFSKFLHDIKRPAPQ